MNALKACLSVWIWIEIMLVAIVGNLLQVLLAVVTLPFDPTRKVVGRWFRLMAVACIKLSPMWRFGIHGTFPKKLPPGTVLVSNHTSHMDCFIISMLPWEAKFMGKDSLFKIPFIGWAMGLAGDIPVKRGDHTSGAGAMTKAIWYLRHGMPLCMFPEGTRSMTDDFLPFKDGAFRAAIETGADILPIAVAGTRRALPKHSWKFDFAKAWVTVGTPISTKGLDMSAIESLKDQSRAQMVEMLKVIRPIASPPEP